MEFGDVLQQTRGTWVELLCPFGVYHGENQTVVFRLTGASAQTVYTISPVAFCQNFL